MSLKLLVFLLSVVNRWGEQLPSDDTLRLWFPFTITAADSDIVVFGKPRACWLLKDPQIKNELRANQKGIGTALTVFEVGAVLRGPKAKWVAVIHHVFIETALQRHAETSFGHADPGLVLFTKPTLLLGQPDLLKCDNVLLPMKGEYIMLLRRADRWLLEPASGRGLPKYSFFFVHRVQAGIIDHIMKNK